MRGIKVFEKIIKMRADSIQERGSLGTGTPAPGLFIDVMSEGEHTSMQTRPYFLFFIFPKSLNLKQLQPHFAKRNQNFGRCFASCHCRHSCSVICINQTHSPTLPQIPLALQPLHPCDSPLILPSIPPTQLTLEPWHIHDHFNDPKQASGGWPMAGVHHPPFSYICTLWVTKKW